MIALYFVREPQHSVRIARSSVAKDRQVAIRITKLNGRELETLSIREVVTVGAVFD